MVPPPASTSSSTAESNPRGGELGGVSTGLMSWMPSSPLSGAVGTPNECFFWILLQSPAWSMTISSCRPMKINEKGYAEDTVAKPKMQPNSPRNLPVSSMIASGGKDDQT